MRISKEQLQKIIAEEVRAHVKKKLVSESVSEPRTVKATPAMLKRIIAEEAAKINEMHDGDRPGDEDSYTEGGMYSDESYEALQDEWAADHARAEAEREEGLASGKRYSMDDRFRRGLPGGSFYDKGSLVCGLRRNGNDDCALAIIKYARGKDPLHPLFLAGMLNILREHNLIDDVALKDPVEHIVLVAKTKSPFDLDYKK
jgi:hypothetical protein